MREKKCNLRVRLACTKTVLVATFDGTSYVTMASGWKGTIIYR